MKFVKKLILFADYFQVFLFDHDLDFSQLSIGADWWTDNDQKALLSEKMDNQLLVVGTFRDFDVSVSVNIKNTPPQIDLEVWDQVTESSIVINSGRLCIGEQFNTENQHIFSIERGIWNLRALYSGLNTISSDGITGEDYYEIQLWPSDKILPLRVLKQR